MILTQEEVEILKELKTAGGAGRTVSALNAHDGLKRLIKVGYVEDHGTSFDLVSYRITKRGEDALSEALRFM